MARLRGVSPAPTFPESLCFVHTDVEPAEALRIEASYRQRGDGLVMQTVRQREEPQPRGEDVAWAQGLMREMLAGG